MGMLRLIGTGFPRTGTWSLKTALEFLLGGECYHMRTLFRRPEHLRYWQDAVAGQSPDWRQVYAGFVAAVDWPTSVFWTEIAEAFPEAVLVLSVRQDAEAWFRSADQTILADQRRPPTPGMEEWHAMVSALVRRELGADWDDPAAARQAYDRHLAQVQTLADQRRLLVWRAEQGWGPLCRALDVPVPNEPFPRLNSVEGWAGRRRRRTG